MNYDGRAEARPFQSKCKLTIMLYFAASIFTHSSVVSHLT
jgi:hypothetical protein